MGFAVLHIEKGTAGKAGGLGSHIDRTKKVLNADPKLSEKNLFYHLGENGKVYVYDNFKNRRSLQERINSEQGCEVRRRNHPCRPKR